MPMIFSACSLLLLSLVVPSGDEVETRNADEKSVQVEIKFNGKSKDKTFKSIEWKEGMTVFDALIIAAKDDDFRFKYRGKGETAFLTEINGIRNEGAEGDNWIFRVNSKLGNKSFGLLELKAGDKVNWTFGKYKPR